jgi:hypothetical protein
MKRAYLTYLLGVLGLYGTSAWNGWELGGGKRGLIPASVRQAPGGYRSYSYWGGGK